MDGKVCRKCGLLLNFCEFHKDNKAADGLKSCCHSCKKRENKEYQDTNKTRLLEQKREYNKTRRVYDPDWYAEEWRRNGKERMKRRVETGMAAISCSTYRAAKAKAIPSWASREKQQIASLYKKAKSLGLQVDHIVPLTSDVVCGLHTIANLQLLDPTLNKSKGNRYWPDAP